MAWILIFVKPRWAHQRKVFGKPLLEQAVIRSKLASMIARVEAVQNWLENVTYQMNHMVRRDHFSCLILMRCSLWCIDSRTRSNRTTSLDRLHSSRCTRQEQHKRLLPILCKSLVDVESVRADLPHGLKKM